MITKQAFVVTLRFLLLLLIYTFIRGLFYIYHMDEFVGVSNAELGKAFLLGMRFDIAAILSINFVFFFLWMLPNKLQVFAFFQQTSFVFFVLLNIVFISINLLDVELFSFTGRRITMGFWSLGGDWLRQAPQLLFNYAPLTAIGCALLYVLIKLYPHWKDYQIYYQYNTRSVVFIAVLVLALITLGVRGGIQEKALRPIHAYVFPTKIMNDMVLNSTFTMLFSGEQGVQDKRGYFSSDSSVESYLVVKAGNIEESKLRMLPQGSEKRNVVLIILESFALEYVGAANDGKGFTPFLDELSAGSLFLKNGFANGRRSIEALPALLAAVPSWMDEPFVTSTYQTAKIKGAPEILKRVKNYHTSFFHGAENGTMYFDAFTARLGIDHYYGLREYPSEKTEDYDGTWGIFDEPFLQFAAKEISKFPEPFFSTIFTLSSHQPYKVPAQYKSKLPKGTLEIHQSIAYADLALRNFFENIKKMPWYKNTLFIITADHTQKSISAKYSAPLGPYRVPFLLFHPTYNLKQLVDSDRIVQHLDIGPTILDWTEINEKLLPLGRSIFLGRPGVAINGGSQGHWLVDKDGMAVVDAAGKTSLFSHESLMNLQSRKRTSQVTNQESMLKSSLQFYFNGLIENKWYSQKITN